MKKLEALLFLVKNENDCLANILLCGDCFLNKKCKSVYGNGYSSEKSKNIMKQYIKNLYNNEKIKLLEKYL